MNPFLEDLDRYPLLEGVHRESIGRHIAFDTLGRQFCGNKGTVLLLSGSESDASRYHMLGIDPWLTITSHQDRVCIEQDGFNTVYQADPFDVLDAFLARYSMTGPDFNLPVHAGFFGYFSYDLKDRIEELPVTCIDTHLPDMCLFAPSALFIHDKKTGQTDLLLVQFEKEEPGSIENRRKQLFRKIDTPLPGERFELDPDGFTSCFTKSEYVNAVERIIAYLKEGDIYQANLAQRFEAGFSGDPYTLFQDLYRRNPASFFSYIHAGDHQVVSTSPERFIQQQGRKVETRPIKGTIARGGTPEQDNANRLLLSSSIKDDAELTMIVDLMRNDLSRVTVHDSVVVTEHKRIEQYENVFHLVSIVEGELEPGRTSVDLIRATFPGGSITGCPKIRAMEIIDELEPFKRHVYTGSIGYVSFHDTMDLSIAIRTATVVNQTVCFSVGGGIVFDSDPEAEFQETLDKGKTLMESLSRSQADMISDPVQAWVDGKIIAVDKAGVPLSSEGFQYGAGLFETIRVINGRIYRLNEHVERLNQSWERLFNSSPPDVTWDAVIRRIIRVNRFEKTSLAVKLIVSRDEKDNGKQFFLAAVARDYAPRPALSVKGGLDLAVYPDPRQSPLADLKTMNYLYYNRAGEYAKNIGSDEALILNPDQTVSETNSANIFAIDGRTVIVPQSDHVLDGVTIRAVLKHLSDSGYEIITHPIQLDEFCTLPNVLMTNALIGTLKVLTIDGKQIKHEEKICSKINQVLFQPDKS